MFGLETLDVLIGLVTIYLTFAVACTAIVEAISAWFKLRSKNLETAMNAILDGQSKEGQEIVSAFYQHPLIKTMSKGTKGKPSYLSADLVGKVVESVVVAKSGVATAAEAIKTLPENSQIRGLLEHLMQEAQTTGTDFNKAVARHFDTTMERATGWFKRQMHVVTLLVSAIIVFSVNVDTIAIVMSLASSPEARTALVQIANDRLTAAQTETNTAKENASGADVVKAAEEKTQAANDALDRAMIALETSGMPLGWGRATVASGWAYLSKIVGLLISSFAISLGAPFWFQILQNFDAVRTSLAAPVTSTQPAQTPAQPAPAQPAQAPMTSS